MLNKELLFASAARQNALVITIGHHRGSVVYGWMPDLRGYEGLPFNYPCGSTEGIPYWGDPEDLVTCTAMLQMSGYTCSGISYGKKFPYDIKVTCLETGTSIVIPKPTGSAEYHHYMKRPDTFNINGSTVGQKRTFIFDPPPNGLLSPI